MKDLTEIRAELDVLDNELLEIFAKRTTLIPFVAEYKKANNLPRFQPERELEIYSKKREMAGNAGLDPDFIEEVFRLIIKDSNRIQKEILGED